MLENRHLDNDGTLISRFRAGEEGAFAEIYEAYHKRVLFFARRFVSEGNAMDVAAESFVQLWKKRGDFDTTRGILTFLFVTARNRCFNLIEHEQVRERHQAELVGLMETQTVPDSELEDIRVQLVALIHAELNRLPEKMRQVFILSFQDGLKPAEIAERLGISVKTVSNQKTTAIKLLREALADHPLEIVLLLLLQVVDK